MIYYVEDDENIRGLALYALKQAGLDALGFEDGESFFQEVDKNKCDLILLDIMLPGTDGLTLLSEIRSSKQISNTPVMMLSAKGTEYDKVSALDAGADDYLAKPFGMMELVSRCKALLRRNGQIANSDDSTLRCGPIEINAAAHEALSNGTPLDLSPKEFELLHVLVENQGRVLTRTQLLEDIWGITFVGETRTVDTHIQTLRRKLNHACELSGNVIQTVHGVGYRAKASGFTR